MKKITMALVVLSAFLLTLVCSAESYNILDMYQKSNSTGKLIPQVSNKLMLNAYPMVGTDGNNKYYLDTSSCTSYQENDAYTVACLVYTENRNATLNYKFNIKKVNDSFIATLVNINDDTELAQQQISNDNGYLRFLFLQAAKYSKYPAAKIQSLNQEAEIQLKAVADAKEAESKKQTSTYNPNPQYQSYSGSYIGNANSGVFHRANCPSVKRMKSSNKVSISSRDEAIRKGYTPCKNCRP